MGKVNHPGLRKCFPVVDGIFYPEDPKVMLKRLASWKLAAASAAAGGQVILAPHGAWDITGSTAAEAFAAVQKKDGKSGRCIETVLLLGTHHSSYEEGIYLSESVSFAPLLGELPVNQKLNRELASCSTLIKINDIPHLSEHSLEVLLPFVKYCFPEVNIVPILMCGKRPALISALAKALRISFENYMKKSLIIISSTVSRNSDPDAALSMADEFKSLLEAMDTETFLARFAKRRISACAGAIVASLFDSGLLDGKRFSSLCPMTRSMGESGDTFYYGAFGA